MRVGVVFSDVPSCEHYRARGPAEALADQGEIEFKHLVDGVRLKLAVRREGPSEPLGLAQVPDIDVAVFVRGVFPQRIHTVIEYLQRAGVAVVVDYDDAYDRLPSQLQNVYKIGPGQNTGYNWKNAIAAAKLADLVTVSTPALRRYRGDAVVLKNCVSRHYLQIGRRANRDGLTVGWTGTVYGHPGDLRQCGAGVAEALRRTGARFLNVGDGVEVKRDLGLDREPDVTGIVNFERFPHELARIDVGIAPLVLDHYRREAKSWLKPLEYLAVGGQYVASPSTEYLELQHDLSAWCRANDAPLPGAIASSRAREWRRAVLGALEGAANLEYRRQLASAARRFVEERHLIENEAWRWAEAWEEAVKRRRRAKVAA